MAFWKSVKSFGNLTFGSNKYEGKNSWDKSMGRFNDLSAVDVDGKELSFTAFDGKVLLITNVACKCGYTQGSYDKMQELAVQYADKGLRILCFPCNQFMQQEPWNEQEIKTWVTGKWPNLNPVLFSKIEVNGDNTHATYKFLKTCFPGDIHWNFATKFVVGSDGIPVARFDKKQTWDEIEKCLQNELNKVAPQAQNNEPPKNESATAVEDRKNQKKRMKQIILKKTRQKRIKQRIRMWMRIRRRNKNNKTRMSRKSRSKPRCACLNIYYKMESLDTLWFVNDIRGVLFVSCWFVMCDYTSEFNLLYVYLHCEKKKKKK
eukprot:980891_1